MATPIHGLGFGVWGFPPLGVPLTGFIGGYRGFYRGLYRV